MYNAWHKEDDPPARVKPVPMTILLQAKHLVQQSNDPCDSATMEMVFYFLLQLGEYANALHPLLAHRHPIQC